MWRRTYRSMNEEESAPRPAKKILVYAGELLAKQAYSTAKMTEKLRRKGYPDEEIQTAIEKLQKARYLDDRAMAERRFHALYEEGRLSVRKIQQKLSMSGLPQELIHDVLPPIEEREEREKIVALKALRKKYPKPAERGKMYQYLYMHGFSSYTCRYAVEEYGATFDEDEIFE